MNSMSNKRGRGIGRSRDIGSRCMVGSRGWYIGGGCRDIGGRGGDIGSRGILGGYNTQGN